MWRLQLEYQKTHFFLFNVALWKISWLHIKTNSTEIWKAIQKTVFPRLVINTFFFGIMHFIGKYICTRCGHNWWLKRLHEWSEITGGCCATMTHSQDLRPSPVGFKQGSWWRHQMETFSALLAICAGNSPVPVNSPHKGQWRRAVMFSLICIWINVWVNNREAGDLRRYRAHYYVSVMFIALWCRWVSWVSIICQPGKSMSCTSSISRSMYWSKDSPLYLFI